SLDARTERNWPSTRKSRPVQRVPESVSLTARALVSTVRFGCPLTGRTYALQVLHRVPSRTFSFTSPTPWGSGKFMSSKDDIPQDLPAWMGAAAAGWRFLARSMWIGPPAPRNSLAPPSQSSDFLNRGRTEWKSQPALPASDHAS